MFELFLNENGGDGTLAEVWIDKEAKLCKKFYRLDSITIKNRHPILLANAEITFDLLQKAYTTEVFWSTKLKSNYVVELYEHGKLPNDQGFYILQEYIAPDLLIQHHEHGLYNLYPDFDEQLIEMFIFFKEHNVYKLNNALANMTGANGKIKTFDFKYTKIREADLRNNELASVEWWIAAVLNNHELTNKVASNI
jgi:hypothetical protein